MVDEAKKSVLICIVLSILTTGLGIYGIIELVNSYSLQDPTILIFMGLFVVWIVMSWSITASSIALYKDSN